MPTLTRAAVAGLFTLLAAIRLGGADYTGNYQADQRAKSFDAWRQRAFFESNTASSSSPFALRPQSDTSSRAAERLEEARQDIARAQRQRAEETAAKEAKLRRDEEALERRKETYAELRRQSGNRVPLTEPPEHKTTAEFDQWYLAEVRRSPTDPYVNWVAAWITLSTPRAGAPLEDARLWLTRSDQNWPEVKSLLGQMYLLGEGGPVDVPRGISLLLESERLLRDQSIHSAGREAVYYALGRAYAEGLGVAADDLAALRAFDQNSNGKHIYRTTDEYLHYTFWRQRKERAAEIVRLSLRQRADWNYSPYSSLARAANLAFSPEEKAAMLQRDGFITASFGGGQPELQRQFFIASGVYSSRADDDKALAELDALIARGFRNVSVERLLPDRFGNFFSPNSPAQGATWLKEGEEELTRLAAANDPRALWAGVYAALGAWNQIPNEPLAERWAEKSLAAGTPWGALFLGWYYRTAAPNKASGWFLRAESAHHAGNEANAVAERFLHPPYSALADEERSARWLDLGIAAGDPDSAYTRTDVQERKLSYHVLPTEQDALIWQSMDAAFRSALSHARYPWQRDELTEALANLPQTRSRYAERCRVLAQETADRRQTLEEVLLASRAADDQWVAETIRLSAETIEQKLDGAIQRFHAAVMSPTFRPNWRGLERSDEGIYADPEANEFQKLESRPEPEALKIAAVRGLGAAIRGAPQMSFDALDCLDRAEPESARVKEWRRLIIECFVILVERGEMEAAMPVAKHGNPDRGDQNTLAGDLFASRWYRKAAEMGDEKGLEKLLQRFEDMPEVSELHVKVAEAYHRKIEDGVPLPPLSELVALLPSLKTEQARIEAFWKALEAKARE